MAKDPTQTVRIRKSAKVAFDERGRSVWLGKVEPVELELVSTTALQAILKTAGGRTRAEIGRLAAGRKNGVLAREAATGHFRILSDADLRKAATTPPPERPCQRDVVRGLPLTETARMKAEALSLVSTQVLRRIVGPDGKVEIGKAGRARRDRSGGFDPYDSG